MLVVRFLEAATLTVPTKKAFHVFSFYPDKFCTAPLSRAGNPQGTIST
jgi:hypothetical protein